MHLCLIIDINKCDGFTDHGCFTYNLEECVNTQGGYLCQCIDGYRNTSKDGVYRCRGECIIITNTNRPNQLLTFHKFQLTIYVYNHDCVWTTCIQISMNVNQIPAI